MRRHVEAWAKHERVDKGRPFISVQTYRSNIMQFLAYLDDFNRPTSPDALTRNDISEFLRHLFYTAGLRNSTRAQKLSSIRCFFSYLRYAGVTRNEPTRGIPSPRIERRMPTKFTDEELGRILSAPDQSPMGLRDLAILKTIYAAGLRVSELVTLDAEDLADTSGYMTLLVRGKGSKQRMLTLRTNPSRTLRRWLSYRSTLAVSHSAVFVDLVRQHGRLGTRSITNILKKYAARVGIPTADAFVHKLRATWATNLYDSGRDVCGHCGRPVQTVRLLEICALAGWDEPKTAMRYVSISDKVLKKTAIPDRRFNALEKFGHSMEEASV